MRNKHKELGTSATISGTGEEEDDDDDDDDDDDSDDGKATKKLGWRFIKLWYVSAPSHLQHTWLGMWRDQSCRIVDRTLAGASGEVNAHSKHRTTGAGTIRNSPLSVDPPIVLFAYFTLPYF